MWLSVLNMWHSVQHKARTKKRLLTADLLERYPVLPNPLHLIHHNRPGPKPGTEFRFKIT